MYEIKPIGIRNNIFIQNDGKTILSKNNNLIMLYEKSIKSGYKLIHKFENSNPPFPIIYMLMLSNELVLISGRKFLFLFKKKNEKYSLHQDIILTEVGDITKIKELKNGNFAVCGYYGFIAFKQNNSSDISDIDYYNAVTTMLSYRYSDASMIEWEDYIADKMMKWLQYELEFEPGETLVNAVSAPAFPDIDASYKPPMYVYYYLLSPASSWKKFGTLDVVIETDQYLQKNSPGTFEKTGSGYKAHFDSLPDGDLSFSLSASEEVQRETNPGYWILPLLVIGVPLIALILVIILMVTVIRLIRKRRKEQ